MIGRAGTPDEAKALVDSANLHRRHLTREQKREVIAAMLKANPNRSNRDIAVEVKASHNTVAAVRNGISGGIPFHASQVFTMK